MWTNRILTFRCLICGCVVMVTIYGIIFTSTTLRTSPLKLTSNAQTYGYLLNHTEHFENLDMNNSSKFTRTNTMKIPSRGKVDSNRNNIRNFAGPSYNKAVLNNQNQIKGTIYFNKTVEIDLTNQKISMENNELVKNVSNQFVVVNQKIENVKTKLSIREAWIAKEIMFNDQNNSQQNLNVPNGMPVQEIVKYQVLNKAQLLPPSIKKSTLSSSKNKSPSSNSYTLKSHTHSTPPERVQGILRSNENRISDKLNSSNNIDVNESNVNANTSKQRILSSKNVNVKTNGKASLKQVQTKDSVKSLRELSPQMYENAIKLLREQNCSTKDEKRSSDVKSAKHLLLCDKALPAKPLVVMVTSMYHHDAKMFIFRNTIHNWPLLQPDIHPVLYVSDQPMIEKAGNLIHEACQLGWTVAMAPRCNSNKFPILGSMLAHSRTLWPDTSWIGFSNGDVLFTSDITQTINKFMVSNWKADLMVARRWNTFLQPGSVVTKLTDIVTLRQSSVLHPVTGIDLFVFNTQTFPFAAIPEFVIGRPAFDNWLIYYSLRESKTVVDVTNTVTCLHQGIAGIPLVENSHTNNTQDLTYNFKFMHQNAILKGFISCVAMYTKITVKKEQIQIEMDRKLPSGMEKQQGQSSKTKVNGMESQSIESERSNIEDKMRNPMIEIGHRAVERPCFTRKKRRFFRTRDDVSGMGGLFLNRPRAEFGGQVPRIVALAVLLVSCFLLLSALITCCMFPD